MPLKEVEYVQGIDKKCQETIKQGYIGGHICILSEDRHFFFWIILEIWNVEACLT